MVKVNVGGCSSFVKDADYQNYVQKALAAYDTLRDGNGAGNDFCESQAHTETPEIIDGQNAYWMR